ncbi:uncharacterized protein K460DRAFT_405230 [Cucurbitaria berberidis CBS 394.84]|uniref:C2H2-type domain-containing protein n=1 Tax=Cucurbitaria berberidis CBS 394.84 TaxID=1168544 RepID=A0A9P4GG11_9PLEO|nr:uncharacterized protein K460DRAFT_405230 [Cucurbitaria berberidis CBS 394.84]KAF1844952.1 hypothetical protein K460DRAFT_405230 [Cucurbitaria berberidis CBS 394.84]
MDIYQPEMGHWRCDNCKESVRYSRGTGQVEHMHVWQCCRCSFAENRVLWDAGCSYCAGVLFQASNDPFLCQEPIEPPVDPETCLSDPDESSYVVCALETVSSASRFRPIDDLTSKVLQNLSRVDRDLQPHDISNPAPPDDSQDKRGFEYPISFGYSTTSSAPNPCVVDHTRHNTRHVIPDTHLRFARKQETDRSQSYVNDETIALTISSKESQGWSAGDSGYRSLLLNPEETSSSSKRHQNDIEDANSRNEQEDTSVESARKRKRLLDSSQPRLGCPFYKHSPWRCKHTSCARPGFLGIHRLKQHLERDHLFHQCERCGLTFRGAAGAEALANHRREPHPCCLQPKILPVWGIDQATFNLLKCRKGIQGKSEEQRWREIYSLVIADASTSRQPSAYVDEEQTVGQDDTHNAAPAQAQQRATENYSRELLRLLPDRLTSSITDVIPDSRLTALWKSFARDHLYEILQDALTDITSIPHQESMSHPPAGDLSVGSEQGHQMPLSSADPDKDAVFEFFEFAHLDGE